MTMQRLLNFKKNLLFGGILITFAQCATSANLNEATGSTGTEGDPSESEIAAAYSSAVSSLVQSTNSASELMTTSSSASSYLATSVSQQLRNFNCQDTGAIEQNFSCNDEDGSLERSMVFTDCVLTKNGREVILNGSLEVTVENGGEGMCEAGTYFDFSRLVMGRESGEARRTRETGPDGLVYTYENNAGAGVTVTITHEHEAVFSAPVDEDGNGSAESVISNNRREDRFVQEVNGEINHDVSVYSEAASYEIAVTEDGTATSVSVTEPIHQLEFDPASGAYAGRSILSGNLIVDHNLADIRIILGVGEEGLTFDDGTTCGPVSGTMTATGYALISDDTLGEIIGTGSITFEDGEVVSADFAGEELNLTILPCH